jgi:hypothetical protein
MVSSARAGPVIPPPGDRPVHLVDDRRRRGLAGRAPRGSAGRATTGAGPDVRSAIRRIVTSTTVAYVRVPDRRGGKPAGRR